MKRAQFEKESVAAVNEERSAFQERFAALGGLFSASRRDKDGTLLMTDSLEALEALDAADARWERAKANVQRYVDVIRDGTIED